MTVAASPHSAGLVALIRAKADAVNHEGKNYVRMGSGDVVRASGRTVVKLAFILKGYVTYTLGPYSV